MVLENNLCRAPSEEGNLDGNSYLSEIKDGGRVKRCEQKQKSTAEEEVWRRYLEMSHRRVLIGKLLLKFLTLQVFKCRKLHEHVSRLRL